MKRYQVLLFCICLTVIGEVVSKCGKARLDPPSTWDIISETATLLRYRCTYGRAIRFLDEVKPTLRIVPCDDSVRSQAEEGFRRLGKDKKLSFCDALSFVVVTTLLDGMPCLSFDRDFKRLGLTVLS